MIETFATIEASNLSMSNIIRRNICKLLIFIFLIATEQSLSAQRTSNLDKYNCFIESVKFTLNSEFNEGLLMFVNYKDTDNSIIQYSDVYLLTQNNINLLIMGANAALTSVYGIDASPDSKYLAIYSIGEGHPWIEVIDLQKFIANRQYDVIAEVQPYPGGVELIGWKNNLLIVESDINLLKKNNNEDFTETDLSEKWKKYSFDFKNKKFTLVR